MSDTAIAQTNNSLDEDKPSADPKADTPNNIKDNGDAQTADESTPAKKAKLANDVNDEIPNNSSAPAAKPGRPKAAKRLNILEKTAKEAEALLQNMGHKPEEDDGRRRTRSQTRGTPAPSVVSAPAKKAATPKKSLPVMTVSSSGPRRRGRPPKNAVNDNNSVEDKTDSKANSEEKSEPKEETATEKPEKSVNNTNETNNTNDATAAKPEPASGAEPAKESAPAKPMPTAETTAPTEQNNEVSAKTNSISADTSTSAPVLDTQKPAAD